MGNRRSDFWLGLARAKTPLTLSAAILAQKGVYIEMGWDSSTGILNALYVFLLLRRKRH